MKYKTEDIDNLINLCERMIKTANKRLAEYLSYADRQFYIDYKKTAEDQLKQLKSEKSRIKNTK